MALPTVSVSISILAIQQPVLACTDYGPKVIQVTNTPDSEPAPVAPKPRDVSTVQNPRPLIRGSLRAEAGLSYAETSLTTQFMNSQSGPTDTPHPSTYSVQRLPVEDDDDSDNEADDNAPSTDHHRPNTEDNTIRPPVVPLNTRPTLQDVVRQADPPPFPIPEPFQPLESPNTPPLFPSVIYTQATQAKFPESEPSRSAKTSTTHTTRLNNSQYPIVDGQGQRQSTTLRSESTTTARPHHSNAIPPPNTHLSPPGEPQSSTPTSPVAIAALPPLPPPKDESDHSCQ